MDDAAEWLTRAEKAADEIPGSRSSAANAAYNLACAYSLAGKLDEAFAALKRCAEKGDWDRYWKHANGDPDVEAMRADPRWKELAPKGD